MPEETPINSIGSDLMKFGFPIDVLQQMSEQERKKMGAFFSKGMFVLNIVTELQEQTDRGTAVIGGAYLEDNLKTLLISHWRRDQKQGKDETASEKAVRELMHPSGPLGSFAAKIKLGYLSNLYGPDTFHDLQVIKGIRNDFAHWIAEDIESDSHAKLTFESPSVKSRCDNLKLAPRFEYRIRTDEMIRPDSAKNKYILTATNLSSSFRALSSIGSSWTGPQFEFFKNSLVP